MIVNVTNRRDLRQFYEENSICFEGMEMKTEADEKSLTDWITHYTKMKEHKIYVVRGELMNSRYLLVGESRYRPDFPLTIVKMSDLEDPLAIIPAKILLQRNAKWFKDIVDSNELRNRQNQEDTW